MIDEGICEDLKGGRVRFWKYNPTFSIGVFRLFLKTGAVAYLVVSLLIRCSFPVEFTFVSPRITRDQSTFVLRDESINLECKEIRLKNQDPDWTGWFNETPMKSNESIDQRAVRKVSGARLRLWRFDNKDDTLYLKTFRAQAAGEFLVFRKCRFIKLTASFSLIEPYLYKKNDLIVMQAGDAEIHSETIMLG